MTLNDVTAAAQAYGDSRAAAQLAADQVIIDQLKAQVADLQSQLDSAATPPPPPPPDPEPIPEPTPIPTPTPTPTGKIVFGVSTHTTYRNSPQYSNDAKTLDLTIKTGATYIRDLLSTQGGFDQDGLWRKYKAAGIKGVHATVGIYGRSNDKAALAKRLEKSADLIVEVTGFNEPDTSSTTISAWRDEVVAWQKWLYATVKANPKTAGIKVGLGALRGENKNGAAETQELMRLCAGYFDFVDLHCYPGPVKDPKAAIDEHRKWAPAAPYVVFSEFGGSTANMSATKQAEVITTGLKYLAATSNAPFAPVYVYELWDDPDSTGKDLQSNFGVYESDGSAKPAALAMKSLVS